MNLQLKSKNNKNLIGMGMMSGTSLDGLDLAICHFPNLHSFDLMHFTTIPYSKDWKHKLQNAHTLSGLGLRKLEIEYSVYVADCIRDFLQKTSKKIDFTACHGHTVFHQPEEGLTLQMIDGSVLAAQTGVTTVCDFRSGDVALKGQGAPLVPIGDELLFGDYTACLNLGGFANISYRYEGKRVAYDISPANIVLNHLAQRENLEYDKNGELAKEGKPIPELVQKLDALEFYKLPFPKSLGREWVEKHVLHHFDSISTSHALATAVEHISNQIAKSLNQIAKSGSVFVTGGGAHNGYLMDCIAKKTPFKIVIPTADIIDAKEAVIFAFLGKLRLSNQINVLSAVTGATRDSIGGCVYL